MGILITVRHPLHPDAPKTRYAPDASIAQTTRKQAAGALSHEDIQKAASSILELPKVRGTFTKELDGILNMLLQEKPSGKQEMPYYIRIGSADAFAQIQPDQWDVLFYEATVTKRIHLTFSKNVPGLAEAMQGALREANHKEHLQDVTRASDNGIAISDSNDSLEFAVEKLQDNTWSASSIEFEVASLQSGSNDEGIAASWSDDAIAAPVLPEGKEPATTSTTAQTPATASTVPFAFDIDPDAPFSVETGSSPQAAGDIALNTERYEVELPYGDATTDTIEPSALMHTQHSSGMGLPDMHQMHDIEPYASIKLGTAYQVRAVEPRIVTDDQIVFGQPEEAMKDDDEQLVPDEQIIIGDPDHTMEDNDDESPPQAYSDGIVIHPSVSPEPTVRAPSWEALTTATDDAIGGMYPDTRLGAARRLGEQPQAEASALDAMAATLHQEAIGKRANISVDYADPDGIVFSADRPSPQVQLGSATRQETRESVASEIPTQQRASYLGAMAAALRAQPNASLHDRPADATRLPMVDTAPYEITVALPTAAYDQTQVVAHAAQTGSTDTRIIQAEEAPAHEPPASASMVQVDYYDQAPGLQASVVMHDDIAPLPFEEERTLPAPVTGDDVLVDHLEEEKLSEEDDETPEAGLVVAHEQAREPRVSHEQTDQPVETASVSRSIPEEPPDTSNASKKIRLAPLPDEFPTIPPLVPFNVNRQNIRGEEHNSLPAASDWKRRPSQPQAQKLVEKVHHVKGTKPPSRFRAMVESAVDTVRRATMSFMA